RFQVNSAVALQLFWWTRHAGMTVADVKFGHIGCFAGPGISNVKRYLHIRAVAASDLQIGILEGGVGKAKTKRKQRFRPNFVVVAIAQENAFGIFHVVGSV